MAGTRCALWIWYRGDFFRGFQSMRGANTVQDTIAEALAPLDVRGSASGASRTDRGVHARMQVVRMRLPPGASVEAVASKLDSAAPGALGVVVARPAARGFHPQWSATEKEYRYRIALGPGDLLREWQPFAWRVREHPRFRGVEPDPSRLAEVLQRFEGTRDFIAFHEKSSRHRSRTLRHASMRELNRGLFELRLMGDSFGRFQVRYLAGAAALVACGLVPEEMLQTSLAEGAPFPGTKAPAAPLVLWEVAYPPSIDPFTRDERENARSVPAAPPFAAGRSNQ